MHHHPSNQERALNLSWCVYAARCVYACSCGQGASGGRGARRSVVGGGGAAGVRAARQDLPQEVARSQGWGAGWGAVHAWVGGARTRCAGYRYTDRAGGADTLPAAWGGLAARRGKSGRTHLLGSGWGWAKNGHAPPPIESRKSSQSVNPHNVWTW